MIPLSMRKVHSCPKLAKLGSTPDRAEGERKHDAFHPPSPPREKGFFLLGRRGPFFPHGFRIRTCAKEGHTKKDSVGGVGRRRGENKKASVINDGIRLSALLQSAGGTDLAQLRGGSWAGRKKARSSRYRGI